MRSFRRQNQCGNWRFVLMAAGVLGAACVTTARADDSTDLLAGKDLTKNWTTTGNWVSDDAGVVTLKPRPGESGWQRYDAYLWLKGAEYQDFEAEFDYKVEKSGNSGFYFHVGDVKSPVASGIEVQIYDAPAKADAKLTDHDSGGIIPGVPPTKSSAKPAGEWNHFVITSQGAKVTVKLNGVVVNEVDLTSDKLKDRPKAGSIGFQDHGLPLSLRKFTVKKL